MKRRIRKRAAVITASTLAAATAVSIGITTSAGAVPQKPPSKARIAALFDGWNAALKTGDPEKVADRYASDAVLLPTVSNRIRDTHAEIVDYFEHFLANKPVGKKIETIVNVLDENSALDTGLYEFTLTDPDTGARRTVEARYTYEYEKRGGKWLIVNHHSSVMPEG
ncbi:SgcJ/EcaC family oxidoreductase [Streptomyces mirabilis]|uniref:SgcJ/EcaC family oxidoreductase n=1 Tax=Streptomyces TaxID=1883 RepID=UPI0011622E68|nr:MULTISPECIES: SgcJ/EcaC family oxidoreductase [Streptomyces]MCX4610625.1 SgcJ/EcaC family oxidoreductase [Streptomyces mirabilis]MCX5350839.1 SgcJ/EcaC family oxidoreductase [Streptomyces mirabilis]QDN79424.1 SgcJ/EcaC family oxidoreductase [Streptomyces sp. S1A1-7]QDN89158.1 SgcJ/EcaC family oxidoreductase [Streptomyces sp. RLB3-6]QDO10006.1 SgcJ/EcaC family oxidoreductase [Streptomyces sp. S1D4-23]